MTCETDDPSKYAETYTKSHSVEEVQSGVVPFPSVIIGMPLMHLLVFETEEFGRWRKKKYIELTEHSILL